MVFRPNEGTEFSVIKTCTLPRRPAAVAGVNTVGRTSEVRRCASRSTVSAGLFAAKATHGRNTQLIPPCLAAGWGRICAHFRDGVSTDTTARDRTRYRTLDCGVTIGAVVRSLFRSVRGRANKRTNERTYERASERRRQRAIMKEDERGRAGGSVRKTEKKSRERSRTREACRKAPRSRRKKRAAFALSLSLFLSISASQKEGFVGGNRKAIGGHRR